MTVGIVGAGIGGLTAAVSLHDSGVEPVVFEAGESLSAADAGVVLRTNGLKVLDRLDLGEPVRSAGAAVTRSRLGKADGTTLREYDLRAVGDDGSGYVIVRRRELLELLAGELPDEVVSFGRRCVGFDRPDDPTAPDATVTVEFADAPDRELTAVLGADGLGSAVRTTLFPGTEPASAGEVSYRGLAPAAAVPGVTDAFVEYAGRGSLAGFGPAGDDSVHWYAIVEPCPGTGRERRDCLRSRVASYPESITAAVAATPADGIVETPHADLPPLDRWHDGRIALVGDAAHASLPYLSQSASQALEDGYVVGRCLDDCDTVSAAFERYQRNRKWKADYVHETARRTGRLLNVESLPARLVRNTLTRLFPQSLYRRQQAPIERLSY